MRVGALAKACNKTVRALHLYEELGLLRPVERSTGGFRLYSPEAKERIAWISKLQAMGFALHEIQAFLSDWEHSASAPDAMLRVRAVFEQKLAETRDTMSKLAELERDLSDSLTYLDSCRSCEPVRAHSDCVQCSIHGHEAEGAPILVAGLHR
jgi:DNA-binding transcriptional MerR regulator